MASLFIVTVFILLVGIFLIDNQLESGIDQGTQISKGMHKEINLFLSYNMEMAKNEEGTMLLSDITFLNKAEEVVKDENYSDWGLKLVINDATNIANETYSNAEYDIAISESGNSGYVIKEEADIYQLIFYSKAILYGRDVLTISEYDITTVFYSYESQMQQLRNICIVFSIAAALILLVMIKGTLEPLKKLQKGIHAIANGEYGKTLMVEGHTEITELALDVNQMSKEIEKNISAMEQILENRRIFIGDMSHEMKTPLTSILGFADLLTIKPNLTEAQRRSYSEIIYKEASRIKTMSGKLMEIVHLEGGNIQLEAVEMEACVKEIIEIQRYLPNDKNIKIEEKLCSAWVNGDRDLLKSLLLNIFDNARKASKHGGTISVRMEKGEDRLEIQIQDFGMGISEKELGKIMEPFYMIDKSRTRKSGGAGLGLALCQEIVKLHKGNIEIRSKENGGCKVLIFLPFADEEDGGACE